MKKEDRNNKETVRMGMMRLGISRPRARGVKQGGRKVNNIGGFVRKLAQDYFGFLWVAHRDELSVEIDYIIAMVEKEAKTRENAVRRIAMRHLIQFARDNGWVRDRRKGRNNWINPEMQSVARATRMLAQRSRKSLEGKD